MKAFGTLLLYFFTWRSVLIGSVFLGLALLGVAASVLTFSSNGATAVSLLAFVFLLAVPYLFAPFALRIAISNRRLALVPGLPLRVGLAMLLLTLLTGAFIPVTAWLLGGPETIFWLGLEIFIIASLYTLGMQLMVTSRYMLVAINWLPIVLIVLVSLFGKQLLVLARSAPAITSLALVTLAGWLYALVVLARRRNFTPRHVPGGSNIDRETTALILSWFGRKADQGLSPTASLLFGYPASLRSRVMNMGMGIVFHPMISVVLVTFMARTGNGGMFTSATNFFLAMSLFTGFITGSLHTVEIGARTRQLWLRAPGGRPKLWDTLERELWTNFLLQLAMTLLIAVVITSYGAGSMLVVHYVLGMFTLTLYQSYLLLCARLNHWSSLTQALVVIASVLAMVLTIVYSLRVANFNVAFLLELCLLVLSVLFRGFAKLGFNRVDWQVLRNALSKGTRWAS